MSDQLTVGMTVGHANPDLSDWEGRIQANRQHRWRKTEGDGTVFLRVAWYAGHTDAGARPCPGWVDSRALRVLFSPPGTMDVRDRHGGFTAITRGRSVRSGFGENALWRPGDAAPRGTVGTLIPGTVKRDDFFQTERPVISARYCLPGYSYLVKVWWRPDGTRIA
jgi:hypothetical protein